MSTQCGYQLRFNNFTLSPSGFELTSFQPCTSSSDHRFIAGEVYRFDGTRWHLLHPKPIPPQQELVHMFNYPNDVSFHSVSSNLGQQQLPSDIIEMVSSIRHHNGAAGSQPPRAASPFESFTSITILVMHKWPMRTSPLGPPQYM